MIYKYDINIHRHIYIYILYYIEIIKSLIVIITI